MKINKNDPYIKSFYAGGLNKVPAYKIKYEDRTEQIWTKLGQTDLALRCLKLKNMDYQRWPPLKIVAYVHKFFII